MSDDRMSDEEEFEYAYRNFVLALRILTLEPGAQVEANGTFHTAGELKLDVTGGTYMFNLPNHPLTSEQKAGIFAIAERLENAPAEIFRFENTFEGNFSSMSHSWWIPVRDQAKQLLKMLEPATKRNQIFFDSLGPPSR